VKDLVARVSLLQNMRAQVVLSLTDRYFEFHRTKDVYLASVNDLGQLVQTSVGKIRGARGFLSSKKTEVKQLLILTVDLQLAIANL